MSMQRQAAFFQTKNEWFYRIANQEYGTLTDRDAETFGPFDSQDAADQHMKDHHSNPGGFTRISKITVREKKWAAEATYPSRPRW